MLAGCRGLAEKLKSLRLEGPQVTSKHFSTTLLACLSLPNSSTLRELPRAVPSLDSLDSLDSLALAWLQTSLTMHLRNGLCVVTHISCRHVLVPRQVLFVLRVSVLEDVTNNLSCARMSLGPIALP